MLLIHPPVAKPGEPPAGIPRLAACLRAHGLPCTLLDASLEGLLYLLEGKRKPTDTWSIRAERNLKRNLAAIRTPELYTNQDRYQGLVRELNRVVEQSARAHGETELQLSLGNYQELGCSPLKSGELLAAARNHRGNLYFPYFQQRLRQLCDRHHFSRVGFSLNYLSQANTTFAMIGFLRSHYPELSIILGGGLITSWMSHPNWEDPFSRLVDHCIAGPGEQPLLALFGRQLSCSAPPDYSDLPLEHYLSPGLTLPYAASSGCYWNRCSFCPEEAEGNPYCPTDLTTIRRDLAHCCQTLRPSLLHFLDNALSPALMRSLITRPPGVPWYGFARVDHNLADPAFCRQLKAAGCVMLKLGLESGNQQVLDAMGKGISLELISATLRALEQAGIASYVYLLFGTPSETLSQARDTLEFTAKHHSAITFLNLAIFNMPLLGRDADRVESSQWSEDDLSLYRDFTHPLGWSRKKIRTFLDREFKRHPLIAPILHRDPPLFTSNHAPFFSQGFSLP
ncbi:B12-binding domain-containing radical SAM protein [Desulfogranum mediterraneum]|uniref:B12-binding domain-containing radical SAM protein n=1 Tax=Desulfogranum mediterraneum TaxID=160661 RepID=UPI00042500C6|nr:radical SAM protein [Desulfogranum mediterraneum]